MAKDADIMVRVGGDTVQLQASMTKAGNKIRTFEKVTETSMKRANKALASLKFVGAAAFAAGAAMIVKNTIEQQKAIAQLEAAMKSTGNQAGLTSKQYQQMASDLQNLSTFGDEAIIRSQALLLTFTKIGQEAFPRAQQAIIDTATAMQTDLKTATIQIGKALNDPIKGLNALSRSGIQFTDSQKDLIKSLVESGRAVEAQTVLLKELETQFGGSAKAARETLGGSLQALQNAFGDLLEADDGMPGVTSAINELTETLQDPQVKEGFQNIISALAKIIELAAKGAAAITDLTHSIAENAARVINGIDPSNFEDLNTALTASAKKVAIFREELENYSAKTARMTGRSRDDIVKDLEIQEQKVKHLWESWWIFHSEQPKAQQKTADANTEATDTIVNNTNKQIEAAKELVAQNERVKELLSKPLPEMGQFQDTETGMLEGGEGFKEGQQEYLNQLAMKLEALKEFNKTESEIEAERYALELETLKQSFDNKLLLEEEYNAMREEAKKAHEDRMAKITGKSQKTQQELIYGSLRETLSTMATYNKKAFELNKKARLAEAVISGVKSAVSAWESGMSTGGPWAPAVAAAYTAASLAKTGALISQIQSQSYGGGGGQGGAAGAGGSGVAAAAPQQQQPSRIVQIDFQGGDYERQITGNIVNILSEEIKRGAVIEGVQMA